MFDPLVNDEGKRAEPYNYTGRTVVGMKRFEEERQKELAPAVLPLKCQWGAVGAGYKERYTEVGEWEVKLNEAVNNTYCNIKKLIDHMIDESKKLYKGTKYEKYSSYSMMLCQLTLRNLHKTTSKVLDSRIECSDAMVAPIKKSGDAKTN